MPAPLPAPNCIRSAVVMNLGDFGDVLNIFHTRWSTDGPYDSTQLNAVSTLVATAFGAHFAPLLSTDLGLSRCDSRDLSVAMGGDGTYSYAGGSTGSIAQPSLPANVALVVSWKEFTSYRGGHPRTYLSGIPRTTQADPQHINTTYQGDIQGGATDFIAAIAAASGGGLPGTAELCVVHYLSAHVALNPPSVFAILRASVNTRLDSQRRRLGA